MRADEGFSNMGVNLAPFASEHAFVRRLLNQRVLEPIARTGRDTVNEHEVGVDKFLQCGVQLSFRRAGNC